MLYEEHSILQLIIDRYSIDCILFKQIMNNIPDYPEYGLAIKCDTSPVSIIYNSICTL
jgi:hypothetical protein